MQNTVYMSDTQIKFNCSGKGKAHQTSNKHRQHVKNKPKDKAKVFSLLKVKNVVKPREIQKLNKGFCVGNLNAKSSNREQCLVVRDKSSRTSFQVFK